MIWTYFSPKNKTHEIEYIYIYMAAGIISLIPKVVDLAAAIITCFVFIVALFS